MGEAPLYLVSAITDHAVHFCGIKAQNYLLFEMYIRFRPMPALSPDCLHPPVTLQGYLAHTKTPTPIGPF